MRRIRIFLGHLWNNERGQALVILSLGLTAFIGLAGVSVETGHAYLAYQKLVASTNAAAMAGAQAMPDTTQATANVNAYSSITGGRNATPLLSNVGVTPTFACSSNISTKLHVACQSPNGGTGGANIVKVTQTAKVPSWFAGLFGIHTLNLSYTAAAAMRGGMTSPWNIAIVLDTTASMGSSDGGKQCSGTRISCALKGVQTLLDDLQPCDLGQSCASGGAVVDNVSLYVFPPVSTNNDTFDYCSSNTVGSGKSAVTYTYKSGSDPTHGYYWVPTLNSGYPAANSGYTYQIIPYSNNYRTSDAATGLYTGANIVKATGYSGTSCSGIQAPGGAGTFYAQVIYMAQADLVAQQTANPGSQNGMIILSDGDATSSASSGQMVASAANSLNGISGNNPTSTTYPSALGECGQAVEAAVKAAGAGTNMITIGYGSPTSGCTYDSQYSYTSPSTWWAGWKKGDTPCQAMAAMASSAANFYSDDASGCKATDTTNQQFTALTQIFQQITNNMTVPRLVPLSQL